MKHIKNILYIIGVLFSIGMVLIISTAIVQFGTEAITKSLEISLKDDFLLTITGGLGTAITGTICTAAFFICSVLFDAITTFLFVNVFSMTHKIHVAAEKTGQTSF